MPQLLDPPFRHSVIYLIDHDDSGAWGTIVNQTSDLELGDIFDQLEIKTELPVAKETVLFGGPVDEHNGIVLHPHGAWFESTRDYTEGVSVSSSRDVLEAVAAGSEPAQRLVLLGHAGWAPGQLESEVADNAWLTCEADNKVLFNTPVEKRRNAVADLIGVNLDTIVGDSGRA